VPLDRSTVERIVGREIEPLKARLGLDHWSIQCSFASAPVDDDGHLLRGECTRLVDYHSAHIVFNPEAFSTEEGVLETLRHELFHCVLAPWDLYTSAVARANLTEVEASILDRVREHATEHTVIGLERMFEGLTESAK
jgi:hypothetical protein